MKDICQFIPPEANRRDIEYHTFVYEAELDRLEQPFVRKYICMQLAFKGEAVLRMEGKEYKLTPGTLFITFPYRQYEIVESKGFTFLYISFSGDGAMKLLNQFGIDEEHAVYADFGHLTDFWMTSIRRVNPSNIVVLTESVLMYTLSFVGQHKAEVRISREFDEILAYIQNNYADSELSISKVADIFGFSKKYLSALFVKHMDIKFTDYLTKLRVERAAEMLKTEKLSVGELSRKCGYTDPFYFSKVFKSIIGVSPSQYKAE